MRRETVGLFSSLLACLVVGPAVAQQPVKATHVIELSDPEGDVPPRTKDNKSKYSALDVVKLNYPLAVALSQTEASRRIRSR